MLNQKGILSQSAEREAAGTARGARSRVAGYSSASIVARRRRILDETHRMIGEVGIHNLCMDEVARRAGVAKRTLYNAFQSKDHLIAAALSRYFEAYEYKVDYSGAATLDWIIDRLITVARRNLENRGYARALMNIYYSADANPDIHRIIHDSAARSHGPWIRDIALRQQLLPCVDPSKLTSRLVRLRFATVHAWTEGEIPDDELVVEVVQGFLTNLAGATFGAVREEIVAALSTVAQHPLLSDSLPR